MKRSSARFQEQAAQNVAEETTEASTKAKRKKKRKDKTEEIGITIKEEYQNDEGEEGNSMWDMAQAETSDDQTGKKKKKKKKKDKKVEVKQEYEEMDIDEQKVDPAMLDDQKANGEIQGSWPRAKLIELLDRIGENIPDNDSLKYSSRLAKLDWNAISFDEYSGSDCEKMWKKVQEKSRCYRLLGEIITEAKGSLQQRSNSFYYTLQKHPEKPTKPLTSFMLFYMDTKDKIQREHPGTNGAELAKKVAMLWKEINAKKLEKYKAKAHKLRLEYEAKLAEFYQNNPDFEEKPRRKPTKTKYGFEKPKSAFQLYLESCRQSNKPRQIDDKTFAEEMKIQWKDLAETSKVEWIELAQKQEEEYRINLQKYQSEHPDFVPPTVKTLITKNELNVLEICSGRPKKPPSNAYSLYSVHMLQSPVLKNIPAKERLAEVSKRWKAMKQSERDDYSKKLAKLQEDYAKLYEKYLNSLSPQKRMEEEAKNKSAKKRKMKEEPVVYMSEPEKPPTDVVEFFRIKNEAKWKKNKADALIYAKKKWEKLSKPEKKEYIQELRKINDEFIENYGKFLQQCPPHKLSEYLNTIVRHKQDLTNKDQLEESEDSEPDSESDS